MLPRAGYEMESSLWIRTFQCSECLQVKELRAQQMLRTVCSNERSDTGATEEGHVTFLARCKAARGGQYGETEQICIPCPSYGCLGAPLVRVCGASITAAVGCKKRQSCRRQVGWKRQTAEVA
jgi:hypothetical protein